MRVQSSGVVMGTLMFVLGAVLNTYTSFLLMTDINRLEEGTAKTFENMAYKLFGSFTEQVLRYSLVVLLFGFVCGNLVALAPVRHTPLTTTAQRPPGGLALNDGKLWYCHGSAYTPTVTPWWWCFQEQLGRDDGDPVQQYESVGLRRAGGVGWRWVRHNECSCCRSWR